MLAFRFAVPTTIVFASGSLNEVGKEVAEKASSVLVVTGSGSVKTTGVLGRCLEALNEAGVRAVIYEGVSTNPAYGHVVEAAELFRDSRCDGVLGLGGGSTMDTARCVALATSHSGDYWDYRVTGEKSVAGIENKIPPIFTVPTTAGTGAEISPAALVVRDGRKEVFFSPHLFPRTAIVDPELTLTVPPVVTAQVGVDAIVQGIEAYVSSSAQPFSDMFALEAVRLTYQWLPRAVHAGDNIEARSQVALAAILSLFAINQAGVGAIHALSNPLSGRFGVHHGQALSILAPAVVEYNWSANPKRFAKVAELFGLDSAGGGDGDNAAKFAGAFRDWLSGIGLKDSLSTFGVSMASLDALAEESQNPDMATNPRELSIAETRRLYESLM
jgi:alcohol dehydrogenase class IV